MTYFTYMDSPIDPILLTSNGAALTGCYMVEHRHGPEVEADWVEKEDAEPFGLAKQQLTEYFSGKRRIFDLPLEAEGTEFQKRVWAELLRIPYGATWTYGELAVRIGQPNASRAVGLANGKNPLSIIVPCHRVIGANGKLVGYGGGLPRKQALLSHEAGDLFSVTSG